MGAGAGGGTTSRPESEKSQLGHFGAAKARAAEGGGASIKGNASINSSASVKETASQEPHKKKKSTLGRFGAPDSKRRSNNLIFFRDFYVKVQAGIWP